MRKKSTEHRAMSNSNGMPMFNPVSLNDADALSFRLVDNSEALLALAPQWQALLDESAFPEPMLSPDWLLTWWKYYGHNRQLAVGLFYDRGRLVGIAPMCRRIHFYRPGIPFRRLEFMGSGSSDVDGVCSEYLSVIASRGDERAVAAAFIQRVKERDFGAWDECVLELTYGGNKIMQCVADAASNCGFRIQRRLASEAPYIELPQDWETFLAGRSSSRRREIRRRLREFVDWAGTSGFAIERARDVGSLRRGFEVLNELHCERWQADNVVGAFASPRFRAFHEDFAMSLLEAGRIDLAWLTVAGTPVAVQYSLIAGRKLYFYQCGRKIGLPPKIRIGVTMAILLVKDAIERKYREVDFLGGLYEYKMMFTSTTRPLVELRIARATLRDTLRSQLRDTRARLRRLQRAITGRHAAATLGEAGVPPETTAVAERRGLDEQRPAPRDDI
jgi:CelD/BcsL family acetyltransferase involved in cellulose biosynthesis